MRCPDLLVCMYTRAQNQRSRRQRSHCFIFRLRQTFFADPFVQEHVRLDAVVCLCDSPRLLRTLLPPPPPTATATAATATAAVAGAGAAAAKSEGSTVEGGGGEKVGAADGSGESESASDSKARLVMSQLALSDRVLLNKSDLLTPAEVCIQQNKM